MVIFLITLILGLSTVFFANTLLSSRLNGVVREMSATIRHAKSIARTNSETQVVSINLDSMSYGIAGQGDKNIPSGINIRIIDPFSGEVHSGKYSIVFHATGGIEGGTIVLSDNRRSVSIQLDPVVGSVVIK